MAFPCTWLWVNRISDWAYWANILPLSKCLPQWDCVHRILTHYSKWRKLIKHLRTPRGWKHLLKWEQDSLLSGTAGIYFKGKKLKELSVGTMQKRSLIKAMPWHFLSLRHKRRKIHSPGGIRLSCIQIHVLWQFLYYTDTFAESTTPVLDLTSLSGSGELSLKPNTLLEASSALHNKKYLFSNPCSQLKYTGTSFDTQNSYGYHLVSFQL